MPGNPQHIRITDEIAANGFNFESAVWAKCGGLTWNISWELLLDREPIESGPVFSVRSAPCLPSPQAAPVFTSITSSSDCVSGSACVILTWQPSDYVAPTDPAVELPMTGIAIYRFTAFAIGRLDALGANPDDIKRDEMIYIGEGKTEISLRVPCIPEEANVTYAYSIIPTTWTEETHSIYSNAGTTLALIDACKSLPYDAVGTLTLR